MKNIKEIRDLISEIEQTRKEKSKYYSLVHHDFLHIKEYVDSWSFD